jgi:hypothetical protein
MKQIFSLMFIVTILISCKKDVQDQMAVLSEENKPGTERVNELKAKKLPPLSQYITSITWRGARVWYTETAAWVDSVTAVNFYPNGQVEWVKQGWEFVPRTPGTYVINGNNITINFSYAPYTHSLQGTFDRNTGVISGTFTEIRAVDPNAPPAYIPGTTTGDFNFYER